MSTCMFTSIIMSSARLFSGSLWCGFMNPIEGNSPIFRALITALRIWLCSLRGSREYIRCLISPAGVRYFASSSVFRQWMSFGSMPSGRSRISYLPRCRIMFLPLRRRCSIESNFW